MNARPGAIAARIAKNSTAAAKVAHRRCHLVKHGNNSKAHPPKPTSHRKNSLKPKIDPPSSTNIRGASAQVNSRSPAKRTLSKMELRSAKAVVVPGQV